MSAGFVGVAAAWVCLRVCVLETEAYPPSCLPAAPSASCVQSQGDWPSTQFGCCHSDRVPHHAPSASSSSARLLSAATTHPSLPMWTSWEIAAWRRGACRPCLGACCWLPAAIPRSALSLVACPHLGTSDRADGDGSRPVRALADRAEVNRKLTSIPPYVLATAATARLRRRSGGRCALRGPRTPGEPAVQQAGQHAWEQGAVS